MAALLPVDEALARLLDEVEPRFPESVPLAEAADRVLAQPLTARRTQPPFDASAMDGYAVRSSDIRTVPARLKVMGTAPAGKAFDGTVGEGEAVRIFTGAPVPAGADTIAIQEDVTDNGDGTIDVLEASAPQRHIRLRGLDFSKGDVLLKPGRLLDAAALSLAASANYPALDVVSRPLVAIIATGDELQPPGEEPGPNRIISSNAYGVMAAVHAVGARCIDLGIAADNKEAIGNLVRKALALEADVIVTLGGASVGDHDLVQAVLTGEGMVLDFWRIAMRPGKPLMFGRLGNTRCVGLPGNPVASLICSQLFLKPLLARMGGREYRQPLREGRLGVDMPANDRRQDYVRAVVKDIDGIAVATPFSTQDSSMLRMLADANGLVIRAPFAPPAKAGEICSLLILR